jgi:hypothetical protein
MSTYPIGFPQKFTGWKGKTLYEVVATIQKNSNISSSLSLHQIRMAMPLKIYRKEIHNIRNQTLAVNCSGRISVKIMDLNMPGSSIVSEIAKTFSNGLVNTLDISPTTLSAENGSCNTPNNCFSPAYNARKRVRSAGMIPRKFDINKNNDTYNTSTQQYLTSRNRTIKQNEFHYIRKGNSGFMPGPGLGTTNIYSPSGLSHCYQPLISIANNNNSFSYRWYDSTNSYNFTVIIPDGTYDPFSLNAAFQSAQLQNKTYIISPGGINTFLMSFSYDTVAQSITLIANEADLTKYINYTKPNGAIWNWTGQIGTNSLKSFVNILNNKFSDLIGFLPGEYSNGANNSAFCGFILPNYVALHYKPNNPTFAQQGAVESSARIQRLKYNTITNGAALIRSSYGSAAANALAYGVSEQAYTSKTVVGDKIKLTPVINPANGQLCKKRFIYRT